MALGLGSPKLWVTWSVIVAIIAIVLQICFAVGVHRDASRIYSRLFFVGPKVWAFTILFVGLPAVLAYWALHHSTFRAHFPS